MATFYWEYYGNTGPAWTDMSTNTVVFAGSLTDLTVPITVGEWNTGTHMGNDDPGTDQCGANHMNNVKYITSGQFALNAGGTETLNSTNLSWNENTLRIRFTDASQVTTTSTRFYTFDGSVVTNEAVGVEAYAWQCTPSGVNTWKLINDDTGNIGGDNTGEYLTLLDQGAASEHHWYISVSARPQSVGAKTQFDFGVALTYS